MEFYLGAFGVLLTNEFVLYLKYMYAHGFTNIVLTNYEFRCQISLEWLNPNQYSKKMKQNHIKNRLDSLRIASDSPAQRVVIRRIMHVDGNINESSAVS